MLWQKPRLHCCMNFSAMTINCKGRVFPSRTKRPCWRTTPSETVFLVFSTLPMTAFPALTLTGPGFMAMMEDKLYPHLPKTEDAAQDLLDSMMPEMAKEAGTTEDLKARDPMRWVELMNACKAQIEEIIFTELVYC